MTETAEQTQEQTPRAGDQNPDGSLVVLVEGLSVDEEEVVDKPRAETVGPGGHYKNYQTQSGGEVEVLVLPQPGTVEGEEGATEEAGEPEFARDPGVAQAEPDEPGTAGTPGSQEGFAPGDAPA